MHLRMSWIQRTLLWFRHLLSRINHLHHSWIHSFILPSVLTPGFRAPETREIQTAHERHIEDVTNVRHVPLLVPQILAMQSKGYNLTAIAAMVTDKRIPVTAPAP